ncbi:MAG TPA: response regulator transcription factor [Ktedonobacteraceae bacterium]|nr:response regulator transcription factor [Ktedonobacteraceae bacterium]
MFSGEVVASSISSIAREPQPLSRLHILLVDSDANSRERIQQALDNGFVVYGAASLSDTWLYLESHSPDLLICEILLGQENGLDLCRSIRQSPALRHLPIMLLTSLTTLQDKIAGFDAGADDYVVKPFDTRHLMARIRLLVRIKRLEQNDDL